MKLVQLVFNSSVNIEASKNVWTNFYLVFFGVAKVLRLNEFVFARQQQLVNERVGPFHSSSFEFRLFGAVDFYLGCKLSVYKFEALWNIGVDLGEIGIVLRLFQFLVVWCTNLYFIHHLPTVGNILGVVWLSNFLQKRLEIFLFFLRNLRSFILRNSFQVILVGQVRQQGLPNFVNTVTYCVIF